MGCPSGFTICSVKTVPVVRDHTHTHTNRHHVVVQSPLNFRLSSAQTFAVPSISLFSLECLEGREITVESEIASMVEEGFNNHVLSIRVDSGW